MIWSSLLSNLLLAVVPAHQNRLTWAMATDFRQNITLIGMCLSKMVECILLLAFNVRMLIVCPMKNGEKSFHDEMC